MESDKESSQSQQVIKNEKKPNNRRTIVEGNLKFSSDFACGNLAEQRQTLVIQFKGNSDVGDNVRDKCWACSNPIQEFVFYFEERQFVQKIHKIEEISAVCGCEGRKGMEACLHLETKYQNIQNQVMQVEFSYTPENNADHILIATNYPYSVDDLHFHQQKLSILRQKQKHLYFHQQIIAYSVDKYPVYLYTITHQSNILDHSEKQTSFGIDEIDQRPLKLKNRLQIVITARVHPSEVSSSFFLQGLLQSLIKNQMAILLQFFIFRIVPMLNPDGVQNGNYRRDNFQQNLNRYYGHSHPQKTPSIFAVEALLSHLRQKEKLFMFMDIHGHNSPKPSFIFGNHHPKFFHSIENKTLCKLMQNLSEGYFGYNECQFSKKNMTIKQRYDEHSKQSSARVFAYKGASDDIIQSTGGMKQSTKKVLVQHSYTVQICPYILKKSVLRRIKMQNILSFKNISINPLPSTNSKKEMNQPIIPVTTSEVMQAYKKLGRNLLISIMQMIGINRQFAFSEGQDAFSSRKIAYRQLLKSGGEYCTKDNTRVNKKNISFQMLKVYSLRFEQFLPINKLKQCQYDNYILIQILRQKQKEQLQKKVYIPFTRFVESKIEIENEEEEKLLQEYFNMEEQQNRIKIIAFPKRQSNFPFQKKVVSMNSPSKGFRLSTQNNPDFKQIENKIRKIIVRHKTQNENIVNPNVRPQIKNEKIKYNKHLHLYTEVDRPTGPIFQDSEMIKEEKRTNPNIEKLMKRISINKNAEYETINHEEAKYLKVKKEKGRVGSQIKKYNDSCEKQEYVSVSTKVLLPPVHKQEQVVNKMQKQVIRTKLPGCNKSVKIKLKKSTIEDRMRGQEINQIADSFKIIAGNATNRMDFILKARKMLTEKADSKKEEFSKASNTPINSISKNGNFIKNK